MYGDWSLSVGSLDLSFLTTTAIQSSGLVDLARSIPSSLGSHLYLFRENLKRVPFRKYISPV